MGNHLHYAIGGIVIALVAVLFGFGGGPVTAFEGARVLIWGAAALLSVSLIAGALRRS